jgi:hypothetical protein
VDLSKFFFALDARSQAIFLRELRADGIDPASCGLPATPPPMSQAGDRVMPPAYAPYSSNSGRRDAVDSPANATAKPKMLSGAARAEFARQFNATELEPVGPSRTPDGRLRIVVGCPSEWRARIGITEPRS